MSTLQQFVHAYIEAVCWRARCWRSTGDSGITVEYAVTLSVSDAALKQRSRCISILVCISHVPLQKSDAGILENHPDGDQVRCCHPCRDQLLAGTGVGTHIASLISLVNHPCRYLNFTSGATEVRIVCAVSVELTLAAVPFQW